MEKINEIHHYASDSALYLEPKVILGMEYIDSFSDSVGSRDCGKIRRCFSDPALNSGPEKEVMGVDLVDGLKISLGHHRCGSLMDVCRGNVEIEWDGKQSDEPLLVRLFAQSLETLSNVRMPTKRRKDSNSQLQLGMRLGLYHQKLMSQDQMIGLNFADVSEAALFSQTVDEHLSAKQLKKERNKKAEKQQATQQHVQPKLPRLPHPIPRNTVVPSNLPLKDKKRSNKSKTNKIKLSKDQIGMPTDFQHISHFDRDANMGLTQVDADDKLGKFFEMVGVSEQQLLDHGTREFIYDFIERNGGVEKALQESHHKSVPLPPTPASANSTSAHCVASTLQNTMSPSTPPDIPSRPLHRRGSPHCPPKSVDHMHSPLPVSSMPPYPHRAPMPLPPGEVNAGYKKNPPPPMPPLTNASVTPPPPPQRLPTSSSNVPGPPPPPPGGAPPAPTFLSPSHSDTRSALMNQIRTGGSPLKEVELTERKPNEDSRGNLLMQIRGGVQLKNVKDHTSGATASKNEGPPLEGMAEQLSTALLARAKVIQSDSDSSDEEDDGNDEWDA